MMAEEEAEEAFFQAQAKNAEAEAAKYNTGEGQGADSSDSDDYDPSKTLQDEFAASLTGSKENENISPIAPPSDSNHPDQTPSQAESPGSTSGLPPTASTQQPEAKTVGGFVVEDEDEDIDEQKDAEYEPPAVLDVEDVNTTSVNTPQQTFSGNANQSTSTPDVSSQGAEQDSANQDNVPNSSYSSVDVSKNDVPSVSGQVPYNSQQETRPENVPASPSSNSTSAPLSASRGRLPHDRVGILEDRVREDPRGDISAWLELINEHISRNKIDNARDVFERFFRVFPSAVSICLFFLKKKKKKNYYYYYF